MLNKIYKRVRSQIVYQKIKQQTNYIFFQLLLSNWKYNQFYIFLIQILSQAIINQPIQPTLHTNSIQQSLEDQFIFQTVTDAQLEHQHKQRDKLNQRNYQYNNKNISTHKKDWDRNYERQKNGEKNGDKNAAKIQKEKKQQLTMQNKRKPQIEQLRPPVVSPMPFYPPMPLPPHGNYMNPAAIPQYYPGYPPVPPMMSMPPQLSIPPRHSYYPPGSVMYNGPSPSNLYPPNPYSIPNSSIYPSPPLYAPQGSYNMNYQQINQPYRVENQSIKEVKYYEKYQKYQKYEKQSQSYQKQQVSYQKNTSSNSMKISQKRQIATSKYSEERQRSRDNRQRQKDERKEKYQNTDKLKQKAQKLHKKLIQQQRNNIKTCIKQKLQQVFQEEQSKQEFLFILRDILKYISLTKSEQIKLIPQNANLNPLLMNDASNMISAQNKENIESNYERSIMKLEKILFQFDRKINVKSQVQQKNQKKKELLLEIITILNMESVLVKIRQNRLRKKMIGQKRTSQIKRLLEELVKDPRKKIK